MATVYAYVANSGSGTVSVIDVATQTVSWTVTVGTTPTDIAVSSDGGTVVVTNAGSPSISILSASGVSTPTVAATLTLTGGTNPQGVAIAPNGKTAYVCGKGSGSIIPVNLDGAASSFGSTITLPSGSVPVAIAMAPSGEYVYVTDTHFSVVYVINATTGVLVNTISVDSDPIAIAITPNGQTAYVVCGTFGSVDAVPLAGGSVVSITSGISAQPVGVAITPDGTLAYVSGGTGSAYVIALTGGSINTVIHTVTVASGDVLDGVAIDPSEVYCYFANLTGGGACYLLIASNTVQTPITVGSRPIGIAIGQRPTPPYPGSVFIPTLYIPQKGKIDQDYTQDELDANWLAITIWSQRWIPPAPTLFFPTRGRLPTTTEINANWEVAEVWSERINNAGGPYPPLDIPRKMSMQPFDLDIDFLAFQRWANSIAHG